MSHGPRSSPPRLRGPGAVPPAPEGRGTPSRHTHLLHAWRILVLVAIALLAHRHAAAARSRGRWPVTVREVQALLPEAARIVAPLDPTLASGVEDGAGLPLGGVLRTSPQGDDTVGYRGPSDVLVVLGPDERVSAVRLRRSWDTPGHVERVVEQGTFWSAFEGLTLAELAAAEDLGGLRIDAVSGASRTSEGVGKALIRRARAAVSEEGRDGVGAGAWLPDATWRDLVLVAVALGTVGLSRPGGSGRQRLRLAFQLFVLVYLGLVTGELIALSLLTGWVSHGVPWREAPGMAVLVAAALVLPVSGARSGYCLHACPLGTLQEWIGRATPRRWRLELPGLARAGLRAVPYAVLVAATLSLLLPAPADLSRWEPFDAFVLGGASLATLVLAGLALALAPFVPMAYCHYGCPTGALLSFARGHGRADRFGPADGAAALALGITLLVAVSGDELWNFLGAMP